MPQEIKYHFNKDTGRTGKCEATKQACRLGLSVSEHYETREEAQAAFEKTQDGKSKTLKKERKIKPTISSSVSSKKIQQQLQKLYDENNVIVNQVDSGKIDISKSYPEGLLLENPSPLRHRGSFFASQKELREDYGVYADIEGIYAVVVSARQGGGNRECYCDDPYEEGHEEGCYALDNEIISEMPGFVADVDDMGDDTYNYFIFDNNIQKEDVEEHTKQLKLKSMYDKAKKVRDAIDNKSAPVWSLNDMETYNERLNDYNRANSEYFNDSRALLDMKKTGNAAKTIIESLASNDDKNLNSSIDSLPRDVQRKLFHTRAYLHNDSVDEYEKMKKAYEDAEDLPDDSELKKYLLTDRGTDSYTTKEKQGRRNVTVTKTYDRGSILGQELESKKRQADQVLAKRKETIELLQPYVDKLDEVEKGLGTKKDKVESSKQKVWESGWIYGEDVPNMPEDFLNTK